MNEVIGYLSYLDPYQVYWIVGLVLLSCGLGVPIPEDITLVLGGYMAYLGLGDVWIMLFISMVGVLGGDAIIFWLGAHYGRRLTKKWFFKKLLPEDRLELVKVKMNQMGPKILFAARFMPGLRAPVYFSSGTLHIPFRTFLFYDGLAAILSVPAWVFGAYYCGDYIDQFIKYGKRIEYVVIAVILFGVGYGLWKWYRKRNQRISTA